MCDPGVTGARCDIGKLATSSPQVLTHDAVSKAQLDSIHEYVLYYLYHAIELIYTV